MSHATLFPAAVVKLLPEAKTQRSIAPRLVILHTNAGSKTATPDQIQKFQARADVTVESHFDVGFDGTVVQLMPLNVQADCNFKANPFAVSIETQDSGSKGLNQEKWTDAQVDTIVAILRFLHEEWDIPLVRADRFDGSGVGGHRDHKEWSKTGHSCPGDARAAQVDDIIARAADRSTANT